MGSPALRAVPALVAALLVSGCGLLGPSDGRMRLIQAMRRWKSAGPVNYTYQLHRLCYCLPETIGPYQVRVVGGLVEAVIDPEDGEPIDPRYAEYFPSVDGLFEIIDEAIHEGADRLEVDYDSATGTPVRIDIDYMEQAADDEILYESTVPEPLLSLT